MLTTHIKRMLKWSARFTRSTRMAFYRGRKGIYTWMFSTNEVFFRDYDHNYNGGMGDLIGTM